MKLPSAGVPKGSRPLPNDIGQTYTPFSTLGNFEKACIYIPQWAASRVELLQFYGTLDVRSPSPRPEHLITITKFTGSLWNKTVRHTPNLSSAIRTCHLCHESRIVASGLRLLSHFWSRSDSSSDVGPPYTQPQIPAILVDSFVPGAHKRKEYTVVSR
ncbi:hypothetical protein CBS147346_1424 [Aspergillus niger]|nr:hypothetical protein CBS147346_1424 [Aspergillus niger]